jgi:tryptophanyl-tRNA synthetase
MIANDKPSTPDKKVCNLVEDGKATRWKQGQSGNPEGMPVIKTYANYWRRKYSTFTPEELKAEAKKKDITAIRIAVLRDIREMMKEPSEANYGFKRLENQYQRDEPLNTTPVVPEVHITIVRQETEANNLDVKKDY